MNTSAVVGLLVGLMGMAPAASPAQSPTFRAHTDLVNLNVTVLGRNQQPVEGLTEEQFQVFEDGVRQEVRFFAPGEMPLDVVILLDTSSSMAGSIGLVRSAATRFAQALRADDRATIMSISGGLRILQPFTSDKDQMTAAIATTRPGGRTPLYASLYTALRELEKTRPGYVAPRRQAIVVLSDGHDTASGFGFEDLMYSVRRHAVPIYTIAPRPTQTIRAQREISFGEQSREQDFELRRLAAETGGRAFFPVALHELSGVYDVIARELAHQYSIGYQSSNPRLDGTFRRIGLQVAAPGVQWRARAGYLATADELSGGEVR